VSNSKKVRSGAGSKRTSANELLKKPIIRIALGALGALLTMLLGSWAIPHFAPGVWIRLTGEPSLEVTPIKGPASYEPSGTTTTARASAGRTSTKTPVSYEPKADLLPSFVIPRPIEEISPPPIDPRKRYEWARKLGGVESRTIVQVIVKGRSEEPVILEGLNIKVLDRKRPLEGSYIIYEVRGGEIDPRSMSVTLNYQGPPEVSLDNWKFPLRVSKTDVEVFDIWVKAIDCDCTWVAELHYVADGEPDMIEITDNGEPFRITAPPAAPTYSSKDGKTFRHEY
jgi:hypothetical protein